PAATSAQASTSPRRAPPGRGGHLMASGSRSPPSVSAPFQGERPVVSGLGLSGSLGSARSSSVAGAGVEVVSPAADGPWRRKGPSHKAMWRRRKALRRQMEIARPGSSSSSERHLIPPDLYGLCFRCFGEGRRRQDYTKEPLCIRCGLSGHVSSQCARPRSPISAEELRRAVIAKAARERPAPRSDHGWERRLLEPRQSALGAPLSPVAPSPFPSSSSLPVAASLWEVCIVQRSEGMEDLEWRLQLAVVMYIGGARPPVSCAEASVMLAAHLEVPRHQFSVHKFHPEDFLVVFASQELRNKALERPLVLQFGVQLHIKPCLRQALATARCMRIQADVLIEGVPSHAWSRETAADLLGSSCLIDSLAPETESREDLSLFKLRVWCVDPDDVPVSRKLWVPEPVSLDPAARRPSFRQLLEYPTLIHIGRLRDFSPPELWRRSSRSDSDSGQSGLPDSSPGSFAGGEWSVQPSTRGVRDRVRCWAGGEWYGAGPAAYGAGRSYRQALEGRVGPSDWRIPPMTTTVSGGSTAPGGQYDGGLRDGADNH
uniref:CCHC-type domain-containing protein n=1 Tax=Aegilops tauschii subsp. strangulata TaxID=200361 RepID=A0A453QW51_AEGTS